MDIIYILTQMLIVMGLYYSIFWILVIFNISAIKNSKLKRYPDVTILVPAYNEEVGIKNTLNSLLKVDYPNLKIYVINDASIDRTKQIVQEYVKKYSQIRLIDIKKNNGKANALNVGLKYVKTEYVAVLDADSTIHRNALKNAIRLFYNNLSERKEIGAVICKMKPLNSSNLIEVIQIIQYLFVGLFRNLMSFLGILQMTNGVLSIYKTDLVKRIGGFDVNNLTEDFEIGVRVLKAGYRISYSYDSDVYTNTPNTLKTFINQQIRWARGFIQTHRKHKDMIFNSKYGWIGLYQFPLEIISPFLFFAGIFAITYKMYQKIYEFLFKLIYTPDLIDWFNWLDFKNFFLTINTNVDLPIFITLILFLLLFYYTMKFYNESFFRRNKFKKVIALLSYILYFNFIYIYVWIVSIYKELKGQGYEWGTKSIKSKV